MKKLNKFYVIITLMVVFLVAVTGCNFGKKKEAYKVKEHLDDVVLTINDTDFTLRDIGYYIINGESAVEAQALIYSPDNPEEYWNKHTNGIFIKVQAKQAAIDSFTRDALLAMAAQEQNISLTAEEEEQCKEAVQSALEQLNSYQKTETGIDETTLGEAMEKAFLGGKYVEYRLENDGTDDYTADDWNVEGICYEGLTSQYKIKVNNKVWDQVDFGNVTIER